MVTTMFRRRRAGSYRAAALTGMLAGLLLVVPEPAAAAAPAVSEDVPVPGGIASVAQAIGIAVVPDQSRFAAELARVLYDRQEKVSADSKLRRLIAYLKTRERPESTSSGAVGSGAAAADERVPIPLPPAVWSEVLGRPVASARLFGALMSDPAAALLVHGLAALDDETLGFFANHPEVVRQLYEDGAPAFAAFAAHVEVHDNRVMPPGGDQAVPLWEALLGEKTTQPGRFIRQLFTRDGGRLAYLYDVIGSLDASRAAFALGLWIPDTRVRLDRFKALGSGVPSIAPEWSIEKFPFRRPPHDLALMLLRVQVTAAGSPAAPAWRTLWTHAFDDAVDDLREAGALAGLDTTALIDAAWLVETLLRGVAHDRSERLDLFAFGQRALVFTDVSALPDALVVLRAFPRVRMLALTLERIGVRRPAVYAALVRQAERMSGLKGVRARAALAQFQSAIALVERVTRVRTIDGKTAEALLETLAAVPFTAGRGYGGELVPWLQSRLRPALRGHGRLDDALIEALAGAGTVSVEQVSWEGEQYGLDLVTPELQRLRRAQTRQGRCPIDVALDLHAIARQLAMPAAAAEDIDAALAAVRQLATLPRDARDAVEKTIDELTQMRRAPERNPAARVAASLFDMVDVVLAESMLSLNYEVNLDVPRAARWAAASLAGRHDFGLAQLEHEQRLRTAWAMPRRAAEDDVPWHVVGAALGLDLAIPSLALRRIHTAPPARPPAIEPGERDFFAASVALMNPLALRNEDLGAIAETIARGRRRVDALSDGYGDVNALAREISMDGWRRRALRWNIDHAPGSVASLFSMTDFLYLGGGGRLDLDAWGMSARNVTGCLCTRLAAPGLWTALVGRLQPGLLGAAVADVNLRVAVALAEMQLPAQLARSLLAIAVQDFVEDVQFVHLDDWLARVRTAQGLTRERIEDYLAIVTFDGPLMPVGGDGTRERVP
jgi:hypothetical protein